MDLDLKVIRNFVDSNRASVYTLLGIDPAGGLPHPRGRAAAVQHRAHLICGRADVLGPAA